MTITSERTDAPARAECILDVRQAVARLDEIHRAITKATGRIKYLHKSAERANNALSPVRYGRGFEHSRVEYAVLESDAERWGIEELNKERDELLERLRPLIMRLPAGFMRAVAVKRYIDGTPCGLIGKQLMYSRCHIYRTLDAATDMLCDMARRG